MSRKSSRRLQSKREYYRPAILSRKRKSDTIVLEGTSFSSCPETEASGNSIKNDSIPQHGCLLTPADIVSNNTWSRFRALSSLPTPPSERTSPLPRLSWADPKEVWDLMVRKDMVYKRDETFLTRHPALQAKMRAILLDWLIEVCEVYRLHRDTYYLALDFVDRFLATQENIPKQQLQLIGITALFLAAKIEEIYPPKLTEFAYVTDTACTEDEILDKELIILKALNWDLSPVTVYGWLNIFLQIANLDNISDSHNNFVFPQYSGHILLQISQVIDLCMLDVSCLQFSYSMIAATALYHMASEELALSVSGYKWFNLAACVQWMAPFAATTKENGPVQPKFFQQVPEDDMHTIQTHDISLQLLEKAQLRLSQMKFPAGDSSPVSHIFLTPPHSEEKTGYEEATT